MRGKVVQPHSSEWEEPPAAAPHCLNAVLLWLGLGRPSILHGCFLTHWLRCAFPGCPSKGLINRAKQTGTDPASLHYLGKGNHPTLCAGVREDTGSGRGSLCLSHFYKRTKWDDFGKPPPTPFPSQFPTEAYSGREPLAEEQDRKKVPDPQDSECPDFPVSKPLSPDGIS